MFLALYNISQMLKGHFILHVTTLFELTVLLAVVMPMVVMAKLNVVVVVVSVVVVVLVVVASVELH